MFKRPRYRRQITPPPAKQIFVITFLLFIIFSSISFLIVNRGIEPTLVELAKKQNEQYAKNAMNIAINKRLNEELQVEDLITFEYGENGQVVSYKINGQVENRVQASIHSRIKNFLDQLERGVDPNSITPLDVDVEQQDQESDIEAVKDNKNLIEIPIGQVLGIPILANLGPKVPVNLEVIGIISTEFEIKTYETGINNIHIEPVVHIEVQISTIMPFTTESSKVEQEIFLGGGGYQGDIPLYYNNGGSNEENGFSPNFGNPINPLQ